MALDVQLTNPPIKEAVLAFAVGGVERGSEEIHRLVPDWINQKYGTQREQHSFTTTIGPFQDGEEPKQKAKRSMAAILRDSEDRTRTVRVARDTISLSALSGAYPDWEEFCAEFQEVWKHYIELNNPTTITKISTRFINEIRLPLGTRLRLEDWFTCGPRVPDGLPETVSKFTNQIEVPCENSTRVLINLVALGSTQTADALAVLLDIDVADSTVYSADSDEVWSQLERLHELKNLAFFGSLTDKALELYK